MKTYLWHFTSYSGFLGIITSKELWLKDTMKMNDEKDRTYGECCVTRAITTCNEDSILYKYREIGLCPDTPLFNHYSMSFCRKENPQLWKDYAVNHEGVALLFDLDELQMAIYNVSKFAFNEILNNRTIYYELGIAEIEELCATLEKKLLNNCHPMHYQRRLYLIKKLLFQICTGYTKEKKWAKEEEYRICYVDEYSAKSSNIIGEILRDIRTDEKKEALYTLGLSPEQLKKDKYTLRLGNLFTSSVLPYVYIGNRCKANQEDVGKQLNSFGFTSTKILVEGPMVNV